MWRPARSRPRADSRIAPDLDALGVGEDLVLQAGPRPLADAGTLATLREALKASRRCAFDYTGSNGLDYRRVIEPYGILFGRTYYLVGPERGKPDPVLWRLDRVGGLALGEIFEGPPAGWSLRDYAARSFGVSAARPSLARSARNWLGLILEALARLRLRRVAIVPTTPVPPVRAARSWSRPLPSTVAPSSVSRFCDRVPTTS